MSSLHDTARKAAEEINRTTHADVMEFYVAEDAAIIERHFAAYQWVSVKERLPELKETYSGGPKQARVMIFNGHYVGEGKLEETYAKRKLTWKNAWDRCASPTHWYELPAPPSEVTE